MAVCDMCGTHGLDTDMIRCGKHRMTYCDTCMDEIYPGFCEVDSVNVTLCFNYEDHKKSSAKSHRGRPWNTPLGSTAEPCVVGRGASADGISASGKRALNGYRPGSRGGNY